MQKLKEISNKMADLNKEAINAVTEYVKKHGGCIKTDNEDCDTIYGYILNDYSERVEEVYVLAVFVCDDDLYIQISYGESFLEDDFIPNVEDDEAYSMGSDYILLNATLYNICEYIDEYVEK